MTTPSSRNLLLVVATPAFILAWFMTAINGLWGYIFDGLLSIKSPSITLLLLGSTAVFLFNAAWNRKPIFAGNTGTFVLFLAFLLHLALAAIIQSIRPIQHPLVTVFSFVVLYLHTFLLWFSPTYCNAIPRKVALTLLLLVAATMALVGAAQHFSGDFFSFGRYIISKIGSTNSTSNGLIRANAFFLHGDDLGIFLCFASGICVAAALTSNSIIKQTGLAIILVALAVGCYSTLTRTAYLSFTLSTAITYFIIRRPSLFGQKLLAALPLLLFGLGALIYNGRFILEQLLGSLGFGSDFSFLFSSDSLGDRISITSHYLNHINDAGLLGWLFGLGWTFRSNPLANIPIDSGYLAALLSVGVVGLILWFSLMWVIWLSIARHPQLRSNPILAGSAGFFCQFMFLNVFGTHLEPLIYMLFTAACLGSPLLASHRNAKAS